MTQPLQPSSKAPGSINNMEDSDAERQRQYDSVAEVNTTIPGPTPTSYDVAGATAAGEAHKSALAAQVGLQ